MGKIQKKMQTWLGITLVLEQNSKTLTEITKFASSLRSLENKIREVNESNNRLPQMMADKFIDISPASPEFIDAIFRDTRNRMDLVMNACDQMKDEFRKLSR